MFACSRLMCPGPGLLIRTTSIPIVQVAFLSSCGINALFCVNQALNGIFVLDMVFTFFTPVADSTAGRQGIGGLLKSHRQIARAYFRGWFPIECAATPCLSSAPQRSRSHVIESRSGSFLSVLPFDMVGILMRANCGDSSEASFDPGLLMLMKFVRLLRLLKRMSLRQSRCTRRPQATNSRFVRLSLRLTVLHAQSLAYCAPHAFSAGGTRQFR